jgi:PAS domain S-box-containing protein
MIENCDLSFFNFLNDLFFVLDENGKIVELNDSVVYNLGLSKEDIKKLDIKDIFYQFDKSKLFQEKYISKRTPIKTINGVKFYIIKSAFINMKCSQNKYILIAAKDIDIEEKYKNIFDNSIQGIFQSTLDGKYLSINKSFANIFGYSNEIELIQSIKNNSELYADIKDRELLINKLLINNEVRDFEIKMIRKNKEKIWVSFNANIIKDENDNVIYIDGIIEDITNKKETFNNYSSLLKATPDMITKIRSDGYIIDIKAGVGNYMNVENGQSLNYIGKNISDLPFDNYIKNEFNTIIKKVIENNEIIEFCYSINFEDDDRHYYTRSVKNSIDEVITIVRDITEETKSSRELRNARDFAENLTNTANVMIVGLDLNGNVFIFNQSAEILTGYKKEEVFGRNWFNDLTILSKKDIPDLYNTFQHLLKDDLNNNIIENTIITKDGEIKYILWQNNEITENGKVTGAISFGLDISDRKRFEHELIEAKNKAEKSDKMKLEFLANMSHDLRTPMNSIIGFSELLKSNNLTKHEKSDYINTIISNGKFLMALIDDIIDISKIDAKSLKIENNDFELNKLLEELRLSYSKQIKDKNIEIIIDIDINKNIILNSDKYRLRQVLMNLIGNAIKFTNDGYVKFGYKILNSKQLELYVEDTGIGIDIQNQRIIFERFKQIGTNNKFKGAGLGLSISKSLVELLGFKEIKLISELYKGSKFYFIAPYSTRRYNYIDEIKNKKIKKNINLKNKNILIVEDNFDSRLIMKNYLSCTGCKIFELTDGFKVVDSIIENDIDLVLLDIGLPGGKDGYSVLKDIRDYDDRLPVIVESALAMPDQKSKVYDLGCDDFISKPFNKEEFLNKIDKLL